jgi:hypothetical protein
MVAIQQVSGLRVAKGRVAWSANRCSSAQSIILALLGAHLTSFQTVQQLLVHIVWLALFHLLIKMKLRSLFVLLCAILISVHAKKKREAAKGSRKYFSYHLQPLQNKLQWWCSLRSEMAFFPKLVLRRWQRTFKRLWRQEGCRWVSLAQEAIRWLP